MEKIYGLCWRECRVQDRLLPVEGLEILVGKAIVNAFVEIKWTLSRWERSCSGYFTLHVPCFLCVFDTSHNRKTGSSTEQSWSLVSFAGRDGRWQFFLLPAGAAWISAELTTTTVPAGVYRLGLVRTWIFGSVCCHQQWFCFNSLLIALYVLHSSKGFCTAAASTKAKRLKVYLVPSWVMRRSTKRRSSMFK